MPVHSSFQTSNLDRPSQDVRSAGITGFVFAILQSACAAALAISGLRVGIRLRAVAAASETYALAAGLRQNAIRIPMPIAGDIGAAINLAVLTRSAARWIFLEDCVEAAVKTFAESCGDFEDPIIGDEDHNVAGGVHDSGTDLAMLEVAVDFRAQNIVDIAVNVGRDVAPYVPAIDLHARLPKSPRFFGA